MHGYYDRVAWIDLGRASIDYRPIGSKDLKDFIGGGALGAAMLARLTTGSTKPLDPHNPLIFLTGPFTATKAPAGSRHEVIGLSPQTGIYCDCSVGGTFGVALKGAGLDGLVFTGASDRPVMLVIDEDGLKLVDAANLWGHDVFECEDILTAAYGDKISTAVIGPAGEKLVPLASISHDGRHTRSAGRGGLGAVMGSKRLKAVLIRRGLSAAVPLADAEGLEASIKQALPHMKESLKVFGQYGTPGSIDNADRLGNLALDNWRGARAPEMVKKINGVTLAETIQVKRSGCQRCPIICARTVRVKEGCYATDGVVEAPEYETLGTFGTMQRVDSLEGITKANELCNRYGMDSISIGATIAFANECFEKGLLTVTDTDGLELGMGDPDVNIELVRRIAFAEGDFARLLGQGSKKASEAIGQGAEEFAVHVKGMEFPMHDPRFSWGHALGYATASRGACHLTTASHIFDTVVTFPEVGYHEPHKGRVREGKAEAVYHRQNLCVVRDSLIACHFSLFNNALRVSHFVDWYNCITGAGISFEDFMDVGARGFNLKRIINNRFGICRQDDDLPPRMRTLRKVGPDIDFDVPPINQLISDYYQVRGWTEEGRPTAETIARYGLEPFTVERAITAPYPGQEKRAPAEEPTPAELPEDRPSPTT